MLRITHATPTTMLLCSRYSNDRWWSSLPSTWIQNGGDSAPNDKLGRDQLDVLTNVVGVVNLADVWSDCHLSYTFINGNAPKNVDPLAQIGLNPVVVNTGRLFTGNWAKFEGAATVPHVYEHPVVHENVLGDVMTSHTFASYAFDCKLVNGWLVQNRTGRERTHVTALGTLAPTSIGMTNHLTSGATTGLMYKVFETQTPDYLAGPTCEGTPGAPVYQYYLGRHSEISKPGIVTKWGYLLVRDIRNGDVVDRHVYEIVHRFGHTFNGLNYAPGTYSLAALINTFVETDVVYRGFHSYNIVQDGFLEYHQGIGFTMQGGATHVSSLTPLLYLFNASGSSSPEALVGYDGTRFVPSHPSSLSSFSVQNRLHSRDLAALAALSSSEAISNGFTMLESNYLENLASIGDLGGLVGAAKILKQMQSFKNLRSIPAILGMLAEAKLVYSFGLAPTIDDAEDIAKKASELIGGLTSVTGWHRSQGSSTFADMHFPRTGMFSGLEIVVHSKLVYRINPDSFLTGLIPLKSLGILPSWSTVWDLVPFSFLVDWFWRVGSAAELAESSLGIMMLDIKYCVHSIKTTYPLPESLLTTFGLINQTDQDPGRYTYYFRWYTTNTPVVQPTAFPVFSGHGVPDWGTATSLVYKLLG